MNYTILDFLQLIGSLGVFLFGMKMMSEALQKVAGNKMRTILAAMTSNRVKGVITGLLITTIIQSSSATTVMVVSFVNAGLLSLTQSITVIMGANVGTTVTAWIISIFGFKVNISLFALPLIGLSIPFIFSGSSKRRSWGEFIIGEEPKTIKLQPDELLIVPAGTLCGMQTSNGIVYTEIICTGKDINMNANVKTNEVFALKNLISYEEGSIANMDVVSTPDMKYVLMAFDEGTGLTPHRAPGNAIVFALEGKATIGYEGKDYELSEGECFRFEKNGLHSVTANGKFKMALLLVLE